MTRDESIKRVPLQVFRYSWSVQQGPYGVSGWSFTRRGALRQMRRVPLIGGGDVDYRLGDFL